MIRGFTLVEVVTSLLIGMLILGGTIMVATHHETYNQRLRSGIRMGSQLVTAQETLMRMTQAREPKFWQRYPPNHLPIHHADHWHDGFHFTKQCPIAPAGSCFVYWDVHPPTADHGFYRTMPFVNEHGAVLLDPIADRFPSGPHPEVLPSSILFTHDKDRSQPRLVAEVLPDRVRWPPMEHRIWETVGSWTNEARTVHLGTLSLFHVHLQKEQHDQFKLTTQIWQLEPNGWLAKPRVAIQARLIDFIWRPCHNQSNDRMTLVAQVGEHHSIDSITTIDGREFLGEVRLVDLSL